MHTNTSRKSNAKKRWPLPCIHNDYICPTCKERIVERIAFDLESRLEIKSFDVIERLPKMVDLSRNQEIEGNCEVDYAKKEYPRRKEKLYVRSRPKGFYIICPEWISEKKKSLYADKVIERMFKKSKAGNHEADDALNSMMQREKQSNQARWAKDFFIIHPEWMSEKKGPLRAPKLLEQLHAQANVPIYEADHMLSTNPNK